MADKIIDFTSGFDCSGRVGYPYTPGDRLDTTELGTRLLEYRDLKVSIKEALGLAEQHGELFAVFDILGRADTVYILTVGGNPVNVMHPEKRPANM